MSIKSFLYFLFFILIILKQDTYAQDKNDVDNVARSIQKIVMENIDDKKIKDSTAMYSFAIKINVIRKKRKQIVGVEIENPEARTFFNGFDKLKDVDYLPIIKNIKRATFLFQPFIIVYGSKYDSSNIKLSDISDAMKFMFPQNKDIMFYLGTIMIQLDKKIYN